MTTAADKMAQALRELSLYVAHNGDDWVQRKALEALAAYTAEKAAGVGELPELPDPVFPADYLSENDKYTATQMRDYARAALAASAQQVEQVEATLMHQFNGEGWRKECVDTDALLEYLGLDPKNCRTDGGWLNLPRIKTLMQEFHGQGEDATGTPVGLPFRFTRLAPKPTSQQVDGWTPVTEKMLPACVNALVFGLPAGVKSGYPKRVFMIYTGTRPRESVEDYEITHWHIPAAPTQPAAQQGEQG